VSPAHRHHTIILDGRVVTEEDILASAPKKADGSVDYEAIISKLGDGRTCKDCDACCSAMTVFEMNKPPMVRCSFQKDKPATGCNIYGQHPPSCQGFVCMWRAGKDFLPAEAAPKDIGWVVSWDPFVEAQMITVHLVPDRPRAWDTPQSRAIFKKMAHYHNAMVAVGSGDLALAVVTPKGGVYTKAMFPEFFRGSQVAAPQEDFY